jgi:crotonobetainyl-CoA:carnitine CoA-transferase CaiB-like acyl-CoA transferase
MHEHPQTVAREMVVEVDHPSAGKVKTIGAPVKFHGTPTGVRRPAPLLGQHTRAVLAEIGYTHEEIETILASGAARA